ncbi:MAG TPA: tRNA (guanosine(46)-N7)-methyltransferase TrmB [Pseudomonadales bacterium]
MSDAGQTLMRPVRSFVMRSGRMTEGQRRAWEQDWPRYGLAVADGEQDFAGLFGRQADVVLEIGFGMGDSLVDMAAADPASDFIGVEVHRPGVGRLLSRASEMQLGNIRVYAEDAIAVLEQAIADNSLARVQIFFPDPWHKKKHHKRRIVQPLFVQLLRRKLKRGGVIHLATDWQPYAEHMMEVMTAADGFINQAGDQAYSPRPASRPLTKFEKRGQRLGHGVWDLLFEKTD